MKEYLHLNREIVFLTAFNGALVGETAVTTRFWPGVRINSANPKQSLVADSGDRGPHLLSLDGRGRWWDFA